MNFLRLFILALLTFSAIAPAVAGEKGYEYRRFLEELSNINQQNVTQLTEYHDANKTLSSTVEDETNRVVGVVKDLVLSDNGSITAVQTEFNRLRLTTPVYLNYRDLNLEPTSTGYRMATDDEGIRDFYPELLASIETAAGEDGDFSLRSLIGSRVESTDGRQLGKVDDVLFRTLGSRADLLYVSMVSGTLRGRDIAVPFEMVSYRWNGNRTDVIVSEDQADAMIDYAKGN